MTQVTIPASKIVIGDLVLGYGARDIKVVRLAWDGDRVCINPGAMHDMLVLPAGRKVAVVRSG